MNYNYKTIINDADKMDEKQFSAMLAELARRYYNNEKKDFNDEKNKVISDSIYDALVAKFKKKFGHGYAPTGAPVKRKVAASLKTSDTLDATIKKRKAASRPSKSEGDGPRGNGNRVELPMMMPSLKKGKTDDDLRAWCDKMFTAFGKGIKPSYDKGNNESNGLLYDAQGDPYYLISLSDKIDGVSALADEKSVWGRGDGIVGADISHLPPLLKFPTVPTGYRVRAEIVMPKDVFDQRYKHVKVNPRNTCSGIVNAKRPSKQEVQDLRFIAYQLVAIGSDTTIPQAEQFARLSAMGFVTPFIKNVRVYLSKDSKDKVTTVTDRKSSCDTDSDDEDGKRETKIGTTMGSRFRFVEEDANGHVSSPPKLFQMTKQAMTELTMERRSKAMYDLDGIVLAYSGSTIAVQDIVNVSKDKTDASAIEWASRVSKNPKHALAFKPDDESVPTIVTKVTWRLTKTGRFSPTVHFDPIYVVDATIAKATGHNAKNIVNNGIGPGCHIEISKAGSIIPFIKAVISPAPNGPQMPDFAWMWDVYEQDVTDRLKKELIDLGHDSVPEAMIDGVDCRSMIAEFASLVIDREFASVRTGTPSTGGGDDAYNSCEATPPDGVHIIPMGECEEVKRALQIERIYQFFKAIDAKHLGPKTVTKLYDRGMNSILKFLTARVEDFQLAEGVKDLSAQRIYDSIQSTIVGISFAKVAGASGMLGKNIGERKVQRIVDSVHLLPSRSPNSSSRSSLRPSSQDRKSDRSDQSSSSHPFNGDRKLNGKSDRSDESDDDSEHSDESCGDSDRMDDRSDTESKVPTSIRKKLLEHGLGDKKFELFLTSHCGLNKMAKQIVDRWDDLKTFFDTHPQIVLDDEDAPDVLLASITHATVPSEPKPTIVPMTIQSSSSTTILAPAAPARAAPKIKSVQVSIASLMNKDADRVVIKDSRSAKTKAKPTGKDTVVKPLSAEQKLQLFKSIGVDLRIINASTNASTDGSPLKGKTIVFTGFRDSKFESVIRKLGGKVTTGVSGKTSLLIEGKDGGGASKTGKARQYGIPIIPLDHFKQMFGLA